MLKRIWTREAIEQELRQYRGLKCEAEQLRLDIEAWEDLLEHSRDELIEAAALKSPQEPDMPRSNVISDSTARIALNLPDETEMKQCRLELRELERRVRRVESWLDALPHREKLIVRMAYVEGMVWGEIITAYNVHPLDGISRDERTVRRWKQSGMKTIEKMANS